MNKVFLVAIALLCCALLFAGVYLGAEEPVEYNADMHGGPPTRSAALFQNSSYDPQ